MPVNDSNQNKPFFDLFGMKIEIADIIPKGALFGFKNEGQPTRWFGTDPAGPEGDHSAVIEIKPSYSVVTSDLLDDKDWGIADYSALEMRAMRLAADIEQSRRHAAYGTTNVDPSYTRTFRFDDFQRIMDDFTARDKETKTKVVEALLASGFSVHVSEYASHPVAIFPESYRVALTEAKERSYEKVWPDRYDRLRESMSQEEFRRLYTNEWPHLESEGEVE